MKIFPTLVLLILLFGGKVSAEETPVALDWWAYQPVKRPTLPQAQNAHHPIDVFVRRKLQQTSMRPAARADRRTLIRRAHYDLTGLPPAFSAIESFAADSAPEAYERLIDRLLASPHFGERWARHWLDVVRFAETNGYERDELKPNLWKYRDWVVDAFNRDLPYNQFVRHQLAGDEMANPLESSVIATGMLRAGSWNDEPNDPQHYKYERLEDMVDVVSTAFLGLTVKCARCHDHKFDPIPQRDYYRFAAAFWPGAIEPRDRKLMGGPSSEELGFPEVFGWTDLAPVPPDFHLLIKGDPDRPGQTVAPGHLSLVPALDQPLRRPPESSRTSLRRLQMAEFITDPRNPLTARVMVNRLWKNLLGSGIVGTPDNFGAKSGPVTHPELLNWLASEFVDGDWSIKRMVRRIVVSDVYRQASIHPEEPNYVVVDSGNQFLWKANRRRMDAEVLRDSMLAVADELDLRMGGPSFYPVMAREALEGFSRKSGAWSASPKPERMRRSVYMMTKRHLLSPMMTAFDFPGSERPCGKRDVTTIVPQALALLNNPFSHERSEAIARHAIEGKDTPGPAIEEMWRRVLGRIPSRAESEMAVKHYRKQLQHFKSKADPTRNAELSSMASLSHVLLNTNEFVYVD